MGMKVRTPGGFGGAETGYCPSEVARLRELWYELQLRLNLLQLHFKYVDLG